MAESFDLLLPGRTVEDVRAAATSNGRPFYRSGLHVRVHRDRIRARYAAGGKYDFPPVLRGHLVEESGGTRIVGRMRWWTSKTFHGIFWFVAALMVVVAVTAGRSGAPTGVVAVCGVTAFVFALIALLSLLLGALAGDRDRTRLSDALTGALGG